MKLNHISKPLTSTRRQSRIKSRNTTIKKKVVKKQRLTTTTRQFHATTTLRESSKPLRSLRYKDVTDDDIVQFRQLLGHENCINDPEIIAGHNVDWTNKYHGFSKVLLTPVDTQGVSKVLKYCNDNTIALSIQGGNTGLVGGSIPAHDEVILSLKKMNKIISFDPFSSIVTAESGVILHDLIEYLNPYGCTTPLDLGSKHSCQIGGNISTNAGGLRFMRFGSLRGNVLGCEAVLPSGEVLDLLSHAARKDNTGFDLKQLFIGGEGSIGVVTKVSLLCPPKLDHTDVLYIQTRPKQRTSQGNDNESNNNTTDNNNNHIDEQYNIILDILQTAKRDLYEVLYAAEFHDSFATDVLLKHGTTMKLAAFPFEHNNQLIEDALSSASSKTTTTTTTTPTASQHIKKTNPHAQSDRPFFLLLECSSNNRDAMQDTISTFFEKITTKYNIPGQPDQINAVLSQSSDEYNQLWKFREGIPVSCNHDGLVYKYDLSIPVGQMYGFAKVLRRRVEDGVEDCLFDTNNLKEQEEKQSNLTITPAQRFMQAFGVNNNNNNDNDDTNINKSIAIRKHIATKVTSVAYGHLADGNAHFNIICPKPTQYFIELTQEQPQLAADLSPSQKDAIINLLSDLQQSVLQTLEPWVFHATHNMPNSSISAEHGLGLQKNDINGEFKPPAVLDKMKLIKKMFDPNYILNPYKFLPHQQDASSF